LGRSTSLHLSLFVFAATEQIQFSPIKSTAWPNFIGCDIPMLSDSHVRAIGPVCRCISPVKPHHHLFDFLPKRTQIILLPAQVTTCFTFLGDSAPLKTARKCLLKANCQFWGKYIAIGRVTSTTDSFIVSPRGSGHVTHLNKRVTREFSGIFVEGGGATHWSDVTCCDLSTDFRRGELATRRTGNAAVATASLARGLVPRPIGGFRHSQQPVAV
jgi:hypothetical protein